MYSMYLSEESTQDICHVSPCQWMVGCCLIISIRILPTFVSSFLILVCKLIGTTSCHQHFHLRARKGLDSAERINIINCILYIIHAEYKINYNIFYRLKAVIWLSCTQVKVEHSYKEKRFHWNKPWYGEKWVFLDFRLEYLCPRELS